MTFLWCESLMSRDADAAECPKCGGYSPETYEISKEMEAEAISKDCGRGLMCCTSAFQCKKCGEKFLAHLEAPEFR